MAVVTGKMMLDHVHVFADATSIVAVGAFIATIELPRGRITSPISDPCMVEGLHHSALFAVRLDLP